MAELWCTRLVGPDDVIAAESREAAQRLADVHAVAVRKLIERDRGLLADFTEESLSAVVEMWPWNADSHAKSLRRTIRFWPTLPNAPRDRPRCQAEPVADYHRVTGGRRTCRREDAKRCQYNPDPRAMGSRPHAADPVRPF